MMPRRPRKDMKVKLSRSSSARIGLRSCDKITQEEISVQEDLAKIPLRKDSTRGKTPVEAALIVMRHLTFKSGIKMVPVGMTSFDKLQSLRTEPATTLLRDHTWSDFFQHRDSNKHLIRPTSAQSLRSYSSVKSMEDMDKIGFDSEISEKNIDRDSMLMLFRSLVVKTEYYWQMLHIPQSDKRFFRETLCHYPPSCLDQCKELARYNVLLHQHWQLTCPVLHAIELRELSLDRFHEFLIGLRRNFLRYKHIKASANNPQTSSAMPSPSNTQTYESFFSNAHDRTQTSLDDGILMSDYWREELVIILYEIRQRTSIVIEKIVQWRELLWRPHPFYWRFQNYLLKIHDDMSVLKSSFCQGLLRQVSIENSDLIGLIFDDPNIIKLTTLELKMALLQQKSSLFDTRTKTSSTMDEPLYKDDFCESSTSPFDFNSNKNSNVHHRSKDEVVDNDFINKEKDIDQEYMTRSMKPLSFSCDVDSNRVLRLFVQDLDLQHIKNMSMVVFDEKPLQDAIEMEKRVLRDQKSFIPFFKMKTLKACSSNQSNSSNATV